jgi:hypothetical protein
MIKNILAVMVLGITIVSGVQAEDAPKGIIAIPIGSFQ